MSDTAPIPTAPAVTGDAVPLYPTARVVHLDARRAAEAVAELEQKKADLDAQVEARLAEVDADIDRRTAEAITQAQTTVVQQIAQQFEPLLAHVNSVVQNATAEIEQAAFVIAEAILQGEFAVRPERVREVIDDLIRSDNEQVLQIICGTATHARLEPYWDEFVASLEQTSRPALTLDDDVDPETLIVRTPLGRILAGLPNRLQAVREQLMREAP